MKSYKYSGEEGIFEDFVGDIEGKPYFRKYSDTGDIGKIELHIARLHKHNPHPNIVTIYDIGLDYLDMELLKTRLSIRDVRPQIDALRRAKDYMNSLGIVYLDWKLDNLGRNSDGIIKVFDFDMSSMFINDRFTKTPDLKCSLWQKAEQAGFRDPVEIDDWIFNNAFGGER
jgi:serine/threonine protein kinase